MRLQIRIFFAEGDEVCAAQGGEWFAKAAALGNPEAKQNLKGMRR